MSATFIMIFSTQQSEHINFRYESRVFKQHRDVFMVACALLCTRLYIIIFADFIVNTDTHTHTYLNHPHKMHRRIFTPMCISKTHRDNNTQAHGACCTRGRRHIHFARICSAFVHDTRHANDDRRVTRHGIRDDTLDWMTHKTV